MAKMQGFPFYDKPMRIAFSKSKSDIVAKRDGTFVQREKRKREEPPPPPAAAEPTPMAMEEAPPAPPAAEVNMTPSSIIFAQNLPADCNEMMLSVLFKTYQGFQEVRMVPGGKGLAFIEFSDEVTAGTALAGLQGFKLTPTQNLALSYAKS
mmetsp:Transcript_31981/g.55035  ORF Transcript_31981/g.55035 Transcript_31981/m.55035 type:complete len:151 (-) Transcript_31981:108-560(-)